jgi:hypothetical protein
MTFGTCNARVSTGQVQTEAVWSLARQNESGTTDLTETWQDSLDGGSLPTQDNTNKKETRKDIHASSRIQTHDASVRAGGDSSCRRP